MEDYLVNPVVVRTDASSRGSIYEAIVAMGMRSRRINDDVKEQLDARIDRLRPVDEESEFGNFDQMEISKQFDKIPKPTFLAMKEMLHEELSFEGKKVKAKASRRRRKSS